MGKMQKHLKNIAVLFLILPALYSCKQYVYVTETITKTETVYVPAESNDDWQNFFEMGYMPTGEPRDVKVTGNSVIVYRTTKDGMLDRYLSPIPVETGKTAASSYIRIKPDDTDQEMVGVGGAFTDAALYNINRLNKKNRDFVYDLYFGEKGSRYSAARISIGSCDFSTKFYDYCHDPSLEDDKDGKASRNNTNPDPGIFESDGVTLSSNPDLKWFKLDAQDTNVIIPALKYVNDTFVSKYPDNASDFPKHEKKLTVFAAPWSPPAWFKGGGQRPGGTALGGTWMQLPGNQYKNHSVKQEYYPAYADYFIKYLNAMKDNGIDIYSLSLNNEAENHPAWECCLWKPDAAKTFIKGHLGPALVNNGYKPAAGKGGIKLVVWDWDRPNQAYAGIKSHADGFEEWNRSVFQDADAAKYIDGIAFHWYGGLGNAGTSWGRAYNLLKEAKENYGAELYASEACQENGPVLREWYPARRYIYDMINCFENGSRSWIDWNLLLDENGGPTHEVTNKCHAPIHVDTKGNDDPNDDKLIINPAYYVLKRMSREVRPGSVRVKTESDLSTSDTSDIFKTAIKQKDGSISLLIGNIPGGGNGSVGQTYKITVLVGANSFELEVPPDSFTVCKFDPSKYEVPKSIIESSDIIEVPEGSFVAKNGTPRVAAFMMTKTEVTQKMYAEITGKQNPVPEGENRGDNKPVTNVSFNDIAEFCNALSIREGKKPYYIINGGKITTESNADGWYLPDENQWRWAAMGASSGPGFVNGTPYDYYKGFMQPFAGYTDGAGETEAQNFAHFKKNSSSLQEVGKKSPNALGLCDMSGNAKEFTSTWATIYGYVCLGGSYKDSYGGLALKEWPCTKDKAEDIGFRIIRNKN